MNNKTNTFCGLTGFGNGMPEKYGESNVLLCDLMSIEIQGPGERTPLCYLRTDLILMRTSYTCKVVV